MSHHLVEAIDLGFTYPDGTPGLEAVSFRITHGQSVALVGANGAGKSTLLLHLTGCLLPTRGTLRVGDLPVTAKTAGSIRRTVGMVFQDPDDQLFMPTVYEDVAFGPLNLGLSPAEVEPLVMRSLDRVDAAALRDRPPFRLSFGEKRRVSIAAVLAMSPDILVMDEPSASLDPKARRGLIDLLNSFQHTKIIATHDLDLALEVCQRVIVLAGGRVVGDDSAEAIFRNPGLLERANLEQPLALRDCPVCGKKSEKQFPPDRVCGNMRVNAPEQPENQTGKD